MNQTKATLVSALIIASAILLGAEYIAEAASRNGFTSNIPARVRFSVPVLGWGAMLAAVIVVGVWWKPE